MFIIKQALRVLSLNQLLSWSYLIDWFLIAFQLLAVPLILKSALISVKNEKCCNFSKFYFFIKKFIKILTLLIFLIFLLLSKLSHSGTFVVKFWASVLVVTCPFVLGLFDWEDASVSDSFVVFFVFFFAFVVATINIK